MFSRPVQRLATAAQGSAAATPTVAAPEAGSAAPVIAHSIGITVPVTPPARPNRTGLPDDLKRGVESLSGIAIDDVRVHRNSMRPGALMAHAFAQGPHIHLAPGQDRHLPHEAWHVVQQKQGRVRPTCQLKGGIAVNDHEGLEAEADKMGDRAARHVGTHTPSLRAMPEPAAGLPPLQAVWVIRGDQWKWIEEHQRQHGDQVPPAFTQRPELILPGGEESARPDHTGAMQIGKAGKVDIYATLAARRLDQGKALRARLLQNPKAIQGQIDELKGVAGRLEAVAPQSLPADHEDKIASLLDRDTIKAKDFRGVIGGQDEYTQSSGSANFLNGLQTAHASETGEHNDLLTQYALHAGRVMSGLRAPTQSIVAAIDRNGEAVGSRHPTTDDQPKIEHGGSGHTYNDQWRSQKQADVFDAASNDPHAPANAVLNAANFTGALATLHGMSWPATASNVANVNPPRADQQVSERDMIKVQANVVGHAIGVTAPNDRQAKTEPLKPHLDRPTSPFRTDENSALYHKTLGIALNSKAASVQQSASSSSSSSLIPGDHSTIDTPAASLMPPSFASHASMSLFGAQSHILTDAPPSSLWDDAPDALIDEGGAQGGAKRPREASPIDDHDKRFPGMTDEEADAEVRKYLTEEWQ